MLKADYDFLALQRAQRAQAQFPSDISETSSQPQLEEENEEEIEEIEELQQNDVSQPEIQKMDVCETKLNTSPTHGEVEIEVEIKKIQQESSPVVVSPQQNQEQALELLKSAFEQIKIALSLLNDQKLNQEIEKFSRALSPVTEESVVINAAEPAVEVVEEPDVIKAAEPVAQIAEEPVVIKAAETFASKAKKSAVIKASKPIVKVAEEAVVIKASETFASLAKKPVAQMDEESVAPVVVESIVKKMKDEDEEFQVVMPKKSKTKAATNIVAPITAIVVEKKDDFPSLVSSFSPVQKTGFWSSGKNSLEIARTVAQIPSPPPIRSPTLVKPIKARAGSRGPIDEDDYSDDEFKYRKNGNDDDEYWQ